MHQRHINYIYVRFYASSRLCLSYASPTPRLCLGFDLLRALSRNNPHYAPRHIHGEKWILKSRYSNKRYSSIISRYWHAILKIFFSIYKIFPRNNIWYSSSIVWILKHEVRAHIYKGHVITFSRSLESACMLAACRKENFWKFRKNSNKCF